MMAESAKELPAGPEWSYEVKLDGFRCIAARGAERARLYSRRGNSLTSKFPTIAQCLRDRLAPNTTLDGEIVALDRGHSLMKLPFSERRAILEAGVYPALCRPVLLS